MKDINIWGRMTQRYTSVSTGGTSSDCNFSGNSCTDVIDLSECVTTSNGAILNRIIDQRRWPKGSLALLLAGILGIFSGCFILFIKPYNLLYNYKITFGPGGEIFELWRVPPVDLYVRIYLYNVTNRDAFLNGEEKLHIEEIGPYVYKELFRHANISFNDNGTLSAVPKHPLVWVPEMSEGRSEDDKLILPNIALLSITHVMSDASYFTRFGLNVLIRQTNSQPLVEMTAREFMFGYESSLVTLGNNFMSSWISFDKLGLIDRMYHFEGDFETVYTGEKKVQDSGLLETYRGSEDLPHWPNGKHCSNVNGASDGTKFRGELTTEDEILFYRKSLCRAAPVVYTNETTTIKGLTAYRFGFKKNALDNGAYEPKNKCFCRNDKCLPAGMIDVTDCYYGFPIALSYPHFLDGDESLLEQVNGSKPNREQHETFFYINPQSGLPLNVSSKFQINMVLGDIKHMAHVEQFDNMILPLLWFDIRMFELPDDMNAKFKLYLNILPVLEKVLMYLSFLGGFILLLTLIYRILYKNRVAITQRKPISKPWIEMNTPDCKQTRKLSNSYLKVQRRDTMTNKELEAYFNGLITTFDRDVLSVEEFERLKEDIV